MTLHPCQDNCGRMIDRKRVRGLSCWACAKRRAEARKAQRAESQTFASEPLLLWPTRAAS